MLPPNMKYSDISGTQKKTISINEAVYDDAYYYADKKGLSFNKFTEEALIEKILRVREELNDFLTTEEYNAMQHRAVKRILAESDMIGKGQITREELDKGKRNTLEDAR
jgi:hypothetical protein